MDDFEVIKINDLPVISTGFENFYILGFVGSQTGRALMSQLIGPAGKPVQLTKSSTHLQWRYEGDSTWINLVALTDITGAAGKNPEFNKSATHIQWRLVGESTWINLVALVDLKGDPGKNVELFRGLTHLQWRLVGDADWINLIPIADLKGDPGKDFTIQATYETLSALQLAVPSPAAGDAYGVGSSAPYDIYIYNGAASAWVNYGPIQGAAGASAYVYIAYASDDQGANFSLTDGNYVAIKATTTAIATPQASDFAGLWKLFKPTPSTVIEFTEAANNVNISSGETLGTILGKLKKWRSSLGSLAWLSDLAFSALTGKPTTLSGYGITDAYTKTEIDNKVSSVYKYRGTVANYAALPSTGLTAGDVYETSDTGKNWAWTGTAWDDLGGTVPLATNSSNGLMASTDKAFLEFLSGKNSVTTLASLPVTKRSVLCTLSAASTLSLDGSLSEGREIHIRVVNSTASAITITLPATGDYISKNTAGTNVTSVTLPASGNIEISIWSLDSKYIIKTDA